MCRNSTEIILYIIDIRRHVGIFLLKKYRILKTIVQIAFLFFF